MTKMKISIFQSILILSLLIKLKYLHKMHILNKIVIITHTQIFLVLIKTQRKFINVMVLFNNLKNLNNNIKVI